MRRNTGLDPDLLRSRRRGALLGLAVGDAFGAYLEGRKLGAPPFPTLATGMQIDLRGGGPHSVKVGQVTDETHMACLVAEVLKESGGYDPMQLLERLKKWRPIAEEAGIQLEEQVRALLDALK